MGIRLLSNSNLPAEFTITENLVLRIKTIPVTVGAGAWFMSQKPDILFTVASAPPVTA